MASAFPYEFKNTILKVENVSLSMGGRQILKDVNVEIKDVVRPGKQQGQIVGFLGPSGIGKTKLFEVLSGLTKPDKGQVLIGDPLQPVEVGKVGVVQQSYPLFNHRTVRGNLEVAASKGDIPSADRKDRIQKMLERFNLQDHGNKYPAELSGGQRQRIAIAQQLLCSEHFLLMDEPFSGLDVLMLDRVCEMLKEIATEHDHNTIIVISHDIHATASVADTLWVMGRDHDGNGKIIDGSHIKHTFNLIDRGVCWHEDVQSRKEFHDLVEEVRNLFPSL
ncbi:MAG: ABC transporter ATP-binding protein [Saprospiraceae bacterium]|nr:ABC transporter ATP-binding protein [Saprospiraceae bacterium]